MKHANGECEDKCYIFQVIFLNVDEQGLNDVDGSRMTLLEPILKNVRQTKKYLVHIGT